MEPRKSSEITFHHVYHHNPLNSRDLVFSSDGWLDTRGGPAGCLQPLAIFRLLAPANWNESPTGAKHTGNGAVYPQGRNCVVAMV